MTNTAGILVWVGQFGDYPVPPSTLETAERLNGGKRLTDRRTKGARYLKLWGEIQDGYRDPRRGLYSPREMAAMIAREERRECEAVEP